MEDITLTDSNVTELSKAKKKPSKQEMKKQLEYQERRTRLMNNGVPESKVDEAIAQEDYNALPVDKKVKRLEGMVQSVVQELAKDIGKLRYNEGMIADAMDVNLRTIARCFEELGISREKQIQFIKESEAEIMAERKAALDAREQKKIESELDVPAEATSNKDVSEAHDGATTFGEE